MKERRLVVIIALVCLMLIGVGNVSFAEKVKIKAVIWGGPSELEVEEIIAEEFNRLYPDIELIVESYAEYNDKILVETAGGVGPDIMLLDSISVPFWVDTGILYDLNPYIAKEPGDFLDQYFPIVVDVGRIGDRLYAIPKDFTPQVLYYNRRAFDLAGVTEPEPGWTWDEFMDKAPKLTSDEPRREKYAVFFDDSTYRWINWIWCLGGEVLAWEDGQRKADGYLNSQETTEAFTQLIALKDDYNVAIPWRDIGILGIEPLVSGRCALWGSGHWWLQSLRKLRAFKPEEIRVVGYPVKEARANLMAESGFAMTKNTKDPEAAWEAIKFLCGPFAQEARAESGLAVSANISVAQEFALLDPIEEGFLLEVPFMRVQVIDYPNSGDINSELSKAFQAIAYEGKAIGPTLEIAAEQIDLIIRENPWSPF